MPFKLSVKIFIAFLVVTLFSVVMMVGFIRFFADRNFEAYVQRKEMETLAEFAEILTSYYSDNGGWSVLAEQPGTWPGLIRTGNFSPPSAPPLPNSSTPIQGGDHDFNPMTPPHHLPPKNRRPFPPPGPAGRNHGGPPVSLFDADKERIVGPVHNYSDLSTAPITVGGEVVGWLGLKIGPKPTHPLDRAFMEKQSRVFYLIGGGILVVSTLIALLLSKHLLHPIRQLSEATKALTQRDFKTRIPVDSSDELGELAKSFNSMVKQLGEYERNQQKWLSDISHELRTPLSVLIGEIEALQDGIRKPDAAALASLRDEAKHLGKIVNDLHELSMAEAGGLPMQKRSLNPASILEQTIRLFKHRCETSGITIDADPATTPELSVRADPDRLIQLFSNLIENTFQHADKPGVLHVGQRYEANCFKAVFEDTGPGVPHEALPHLFDRLYRADPSRSRATGGSGLGLAICQSIVENHQGRIQARNGERGGLRIEVELPLEENTQV